MRSWNIEIVMMLISSYITTSASFTIRPPLTINSHCRVLSSTASNDMMDKTNTPSSSSSSKIVNSKSSQMDISSWEDLEDTLKTLSQESDKREPMITFYRDTNGWCPFCERVWVILRAKNIPYRERQISLFQKPDWYKELVPTTQVPAILLHQTSEEEGAKLNNTRTIVWESLDIMKVLDDAFPLTPQMVFENDSKYVEASEIMDSLGTAGFKYIYSGRNLKNNNTLTAEQEEKQEETIKQSFILALDDLESFLLSTSSSHDDSFSYFALGSKFTAIDAIMIPMLERWRYQMPLSKQFNILEGRPALQRWFETMDSFKPYCERVMGDEYSWVATSSVFARYFSSGEEDCEAMEIIQRSDQRARDLEESFSLPLNQSINNDDNPIEIQFALEAATKVVTNREAIVKDCTNTEPKSQMHIPRATNQDNADLLLRFLTMHLLTNHPLRSIQNIAMEEWSHSFTRNDDTINQRLDMARAAKTIASRLCVPRDMSAPAAKILRAMLYFTAEKLLISSEEGS